MRISIFQADRAKKQNYRGLSNPISAEKRAGGFPGIGSF
jgi:hypothetical protein